MKDVIFLQTLIFSLLILTTTSRKRVCTISGHHCNSTVRGAPDPCLSGLNAVNGMDGKLRHTCAKNKYVNGFCDYCPESHDTPLSGPSFRVNGTACRQEDGFYKCQVGTPGVNCVRRTWIRQAKACSYRTETVNTKLNCTDNEITCKILGRCVERQDVNSEMTCNGEPRKFYLPCHEDEFKCQNSGLCLPRSWVKDGSVDCTIHNRVNDTSDENSPLAKCNPETEFRCGNGRCIPRDLVMDGRPNCPHSSDEHRPLNCHTHNEYRCQSNGRCVPRYRVNDGFPDCPEGSDESLSSFQCKNRTEFDCGDGRCIPRSWVGNSLLDCKTGIDEQTKLNKCFDNEFMCKDRSRCLPHRFLCDGVQNCDDCSDEVELCDEPRRFRCKDDPSVCIPWTHTCDQSPDCKDGSDEQTHKLQGFKCQVNGETCYVPQFMTKTKIEMCVKATSSSVCYDNDGKFLCAKCLDGKTISKSQVCDGIIDCSDLSDECPCEETKARPICDKIFAKQNNATSVKHAMRYVCNGRTEWENATDEQYCTKTQVFKLPTSPSTAVRNNYKCQTLSEDAIKLAEKYGQKDRLIGMLKVNASKCDGNIECLFFDDECSTDCANPPKFCKTIPLKFIQVTSDFGITMRTCDVRGALKDVIFPQWLCDGVTHCASGNDKKNCRGRYYCDGGTRVTVTAGVRPVVNIPASRKCDLKADCSDSSDELNCSKTTHFYCKEKQPKFIAKKRYLDGEVDCLDFSDECPIDKYKSNVFSSPTELLSSIVLKVFIWVVATTSVLGNMWVIIETLCELQYVKDKNSVGYCNRMLIVHLGLADLLTGVCLWILIVKSLEFSGKYCLYEAEWTLSRTCNLIGILLVISSQTSLNVLTSLTALRLFTIINPLKRISRYYSFFLAFISWFVSVCIAIVPILDSQKQYFSYSVMISKNLYFKTREVDTLVESKYYEMTKAISRLHDGNNTGDLFATKANFSHQSVKTMFPERYLHIDGVYGYYSSNSVCFPNFFDISKSYFSLVVVTLNTLSILFIACCYVVFYYKSSSKNVATRTAAHSERNERLRRKITVVVMTSALCWLPICAMAFYNFANKDLPQVTYVIAAVVLLPIDSCFNPLLYSEVHIKVFNLLKALFMPRSPDELGGDTELTNLSKGNSSKFYSRSGQTRAREQRSSH